MSILGFVPDDGYSEAGFIEEAQRLHPALRFTFRPMLQTERALYLRACDGAAGPLEVRKLMAQVLAQKLASWDLRNARDEAVPVTVDILLRVKQRLFDRMFLIVSGESPSDDDPQRKASPAEKNEEARRLFEALSEGKNLRDVAEAADAKN